MNRSEDIGQLAAALAAAQGKMKPAGMNAVNPFLKNTYADLGAVIEAIRPVLADNGLSFTQLPETGDGTVTLETVIMHSSGQWISSVQAVSVDAEKGLSSAQITGKAITYLRRYALSAMFGVYADKDEDGNDHVDPETGEIRPRRLQPAPKGTRPPEQTEPAPVGLPMTEGQRKRLHGLGNAAYGPDWDAKRHELVTAITKGRSESSADLTEQEAAALIRGIERKLDASTVQVGEQAPAFPDAEDLHPDSAHLEPV